MSEITIKGILEISQPLGTFLIGIMKAKDLLKITKPDPREYNEELDEYAGIQREINNKKISQLKKFIKTSDATFPNTIIGTLKPDSFDFDEKRRILKIKEDEESFAVIDGQHRLASFKNEGINNDFELIVAFFLGLDLEEQAYLFSIINMTQKKLNPSLVEDLTELFTIMTPEKFAHNIAKTFNDEKGPWYKKIKMLGKNVGGYKGILSQYTFTKGITMLIADMDEYYKIRDILKKNNGNRKELKNLGMDKERYVFWELYINEKDVEFYKILKNYFNTLKRLYEEEWGNPNYILTKTTGYKAFMKFLGELYKIAKKEGKDVTESFFLNYLEKVKKNTKKLTSLNYNPGAQGEKRLYEDIIKSLK